MYSNREEYSIFYFKFVNDTFLLLIIDSLNSITNSQVNKYQYLILDTTCPKSQPLYMMAISDTKWQRLMILYIRISI